MIAFSVRSIGRSGCLMVFAAALAIGGTVVAPLAVPSRLAAHAAVISVTVRERLSNYGAWQMSRRLGEVWVPTVAAGWRPYTDGRWVWTDAGWYWQSAEPFGAIVYHYGNWVYDDELGWVWIAGDEWAPAWVVWRESDEDIGWMPAPPPAIHVVVEDAWWVFAPVAAISAVNILHQVRPVEENVTIVRNTTIINNMTVVNNNYGDHRTVRLGNATVPVNAGPQLSHLPRPVFTALKAATVVPPAKGKFVAAHLDTTKGAAVKQLAIRQVGPNSGPADRQASQTVVKPGAKAANGRQPPNAPKEPAVAAGGKAGAVKPGPSAAIAKQAQAGRPAFVAPAGTTKQPSISHMQASRMAKVAPARPAPIKKQAANKPHPNHMASVGRPAPRRMPVNAQVARLNRPKPKAAMPHHPAPAGKRAPASCNPRNPHCKRPG